MRASTMTRPCASTTASFFASATASITRSTMTKPNKDPRRRCKPVVEWPAEDRAAWAAAMRSADPFEDPGRGAYWRPNTRKTIAKAYGRYLTFLETRDWLELNEGPASRPTQERLDAYVDELRTQ